MNSKWITDRLPTAEDCNKSADVVWVSGSHIAYIDHWSNVKEGETWMPITPPEPYEKPKRWRLVYHEDAFDGSYYSIVSSGTHAVYRLPVLYRREHREAAERIAAIYEEVMP